MEAGIGAEASSQRWAMQVIVHEGPRQKAEHNSVLKSGLFTHKLTCTYERQAMHRRGGRAGRGRNNSQKKFPNSCLSNNTNYCTHVNKYGKLTSM